MDADMLGNWRLIQRSNEEEIIALMKQVPREQWDKYKQLPGVGEKVEAAIAEIEAESLQHEAEKVREQDNAVTDYRESGAIDINELTSYPSLTTVKNAVIIARTYKDYAMAVRFPKLVEATFDIGNGNYAPILYRSILGKRNPKDLDITIGFASSRALHAIVFRKGDCYTTEKSVSQALMGLVIQYKMDLYLMFKPSRKFLDSMTSVGLKVYYPPNSSYMALTRSSMNFIEGARFGLTHPNRPPGNSNIPLMTSAIAQSGFITKRAFFGLFLGYLIEAGNIDYCESGSLLDSTNETFMLTDDLRKYLGRVLPDLLSEDYCVPGVEDIIFLSTVLRTGIFYYPSGFTNQGYGLRSINDLVGLPIPKFPTSTRGVKLFRDDIRILESINRPARGSRVYRSDGSSYIVGREVTVSPPSVGDQLSMDSTSSTFEGFSDNSYSPEMRYAGRLGTSLPTEAEWDTEYKSPYKGVRSLEEGNMSPQERLVNVPLTVTMDQTRVVTRGFRDRTSISVYPTKGS